MQQNVVKSYSDAIYDLFEETKDKKLLEDLKQIYRVLKINYEYVDYIACRYFSKEERKASILKLFDKRVNPIVLNMMQLLIDQEKAGNICYIIKRAIKLINQELDIDFALIETPFELDQNQIDALTKALSKKYNKKIDYEIRINPQLIGGVKITVNNDIIDGSIKGKLDNIKSSFIKDMKEGV